MEENRIEEIKITDYIRVVIKRKWIIVFGTLFCMVVAGVVSFIMPKVYEAKVYLMVTSPKYKVEFATKEGSKISTPIFENVSAETFSKMILNELTAKIVIEKLGLEHSSFGYSVGRILKQIKVEYPRNTNLILIKVQDKSKERASQIANEWASVFIERNEEVISKEAKETYLFVAEQLEKVKLSLKAAEEELERFQKANKIDLLKEQISGKIKQIVQYENKLDDAIRAQLNEKARYEELTNQIKDQPKTIPIDKGLIGKEEINPIYLNLNQRILETAVSIQVFEAEILQLKKNIKNLNEEVSELKKRLAEQELIQTRLMRDVETAKSTFEILSKKGEETKITSAIRTANIQISIPATPPENPVKPKKKQNILIGGIIGFFTSVLFTLFMEFLEKEKNKPATSITPL